MKTTIIPHPASTYGAITYPKAVRYDNGRTFAKTTDGAIYEVGARMNGYYPIKAELKQGDPKYKRATILFATPLPTWRDICTA